MRRLIILLVFTMTAALTAQESAVPKTPLVITVASYRVTGFAFEREPDWRFVITFVHLDGTGKVVRTERDEHHGLTSRPNPAGGVINNPDGADALLKQLFQADLSKLSLMKVLMRHLETHGKIPPSTMTGNPE